MGDTLVCFIAKGALQLPDKVLRYSRFEVSHAGGRARQHDLAFSKRLDLPLAGAFFAVEKQSGRAARISLEAPANVRVERRPLTPLAALQGAENNNGLRCQAKQG
ncbi:MAG: hypothetical protein K2X46_17820 [Roseomonas sp.]|nr:hypothetical protein [Roseomonas sp.]